MSYIVHALTASDWAAFREAGTYRPPSLDAEGFVHCSKPGQIVVVADTVHAAADDLVLLLLDESRLDAPVRYGAGDGESAFPHVYGPLTLAAVVESFPFERDETGYRLPAALFAY